MRERSFSSETVQQIVIEPAAGWRLIDWRELRQYRDLFYFLVMRDIQVLYKQTVLGFAWALIRPLFSMIIFTIIFGNLAAVSSDGVPYAIFNYVALVPWLYFSTSFSGSALSLVSNADMLTKVYFPRLAFPMTAVFAKMVDFLIAFALVAVLMVWFGVAPGRNVMYLPLLVALMMLAAAGAGLWLSALAVQYRDVKHALPFLVQILMYAAPVVWPASLISERYGQTARLIYGLYPMAGVIEGFRAALLNTTPMPWDLIGMGFLASAVLFISGAFYFRRMEFLFADLA